MSLHLLVFSTITINLQHISNKIKYKQNTMSHMLPWLIITMIFCHVGWSFKTKHHNFLKV
jgi:hypothetical protein